ncbi:SPOR domain-containing protein [Novosphingobium sp. RD2P27]|uniref:SPOR domain-containing protein n=1 Tax=Novosphingobium kalidii TaxID=3230299 RepID=A0ABV2D051_9SPHN
MSFPSEGREGSGEPQGYESGKAQGFSAPSKFSAPQDDRRFDSRFAAADELDLGDDDIRLPWLEGDDNDEDEQPGHNTAQLLVFVLMGLVALALIVGAIWWAQRDGADQTLVADGATIESPDAPYKTRPDDPGGEFVAGSGDTSFAVAEGQTRQVRIDSSAPVPTSTPTAEVSPAAASSTPAAEAQGSGDTSGVGVQVAAYSTRELAEQGWSRLSQQYDMLSGARYRIVEGRADIGTVYRLQVMAGDVAAANQLCTNLKNAGLSCQVKR